MIENEIPKYNGIYQIRNEDDYIHFVNTSIQKLIVVEFWANWCHSCKLTLPFLEKIAAQFQDVLFAQINIDELDALASSYSVRNIPSFAFIKNGLMLHLIGSPDKDRITNTIQTIK